MDEKSLASVLLRIMQLAVQVIGPNSHALSEVETAIELATELATKITTSPDLRQKVLYLLSTNEFVAPLQHFTAVMPSDSFYEKGHVNGVCTIRSLASQRKLQQRFCFLLLQTGLHTSSNEMSLDSRLATALLEKQISLAHGLKGCHFAPTGKASGAISLFETQSTQDMPSKAWRERLKDNLTKDAEFQQHSIVKIVDEVCRDLEARCDDAERPYREELAKTLNLELRVKALDSRVAALQSQNADYIQSITELESEKAQFVQKAETVDVRVQTMADETEDLKKRIENLKLEASRTENALSEAARHQDLLYMATMTGKDEELERKDFKIHALESRVSLLEQDLSLSVAQEKKGTDDAKQLEATLAQQSDELIRAKDLNTEKQAEIESLSSSRSCLASDNETLRSRVRYPSFGISFSVFFA